MNHLLHILKRAGSTFMGACIVLGPLYAVGSLLGLGKLDPARGEAATNQMGSTGIWFVALLGLSLLAGAALGLRDVLGGRSRE